MIFEKIKIFERDEGSNVSMIEVIFEVLAQSWRMLEKFSASNFWSYDS